MPLINFRTDLTAVPYQYDRPGGGYSGQPYIKTPIPGISTMTQPFGAYQEANRTTLDYPIRGGVITSAGLNGASSTLAGEIDRMRIKAFLEDKARGTTFLLKQRGLQLTNPNIPQPGTNIANGIIPVTRQYDETGEVILAQVTVQGTGQHIQRHGLKPLFVTPEKEDYYSYTKNTNNVLNNRLLLLYQTKVAKDNPLSSFFISDYYNVLRAGVGLAYGELAKKYGISPNFTELYNYEGGPGSTYGVGKTIIKRVDDTTDAAFKAAILNNTFTLTYQQLLNQNTSTGTIFEQVPRQKIGAKLQDFRAQLNTATGAPANYLTANYTDATKWYNPALRGNPGGLEPRRRITYKVVNEAKVDQLNKVGLYYYNPQSESPFDSSYKDIIKFGFECISNDKPDEAIALFFRAFLTDFTDNHQGEYNSFKYLGRGETFRTYQGFDRSVNFSFKIAAQTRSEMAPLYTKLNHLISQVYPDYSPTSQFMRAPLIKLTIGDYMYRLPGFLDSINLTVLNESAWEIALDPTGLDADMNQMPQMIQVQCSFKPIHDFLPQRETVGGKDNVMGGSRVVPLIGRRKSDGTSWIGDNRIATDKASPAVSKKIEEQKWKNSGSDGVDEFVFGLRQEEEEKLRLEQEAAAAAATTAASGAPANPTGTITPNAGANLRKAACATASGDLVIAVNKGTTVEILAEQTPSNCAKFPKAWYNVKVINDPNNASAAGKEGWVYSTLVKK